MKFFKFWDNHSLIVRSRGGDRAESKEADISLFQQIINEHRKYIESSASRSVDQQGPPANQNLIDAITGLSQAAQEQLLNYAVTNNCEKFQEWLVENEIFSEKKINRLKSKTELETEIGTELDLDRELPRTKKQWGEFFANIYEGEEVEEGATDKRWDEVFTKIYKEEDPEKLISEILGADLVVEDLAALSPLIKDNYLEITSFVKLVQLWKKYSAELISEIEYHEFNWKSEKDLLELQERLDEFSALPLELKQQILLPFIEAEANLDMIGLPESTSPIKAVRETGAEDLSNISLSFDSERSDSEFEDEERGSLKHQSKAEYEDVQPSDLSMLPAEHYIVIAEAALRVLYPTADKKFIIQKMQGEIGGVQGGIAGEAVDRIYDFLEGNRQISTDPRELQEERYSVIAEAALRVLYPTADEKFIIQKMQGAIRVVQGGTTGEAVDRIYDELSVRLAKLEEGKDRGANSGAAGIWVEKAIEQNAKGATEGKTR